MRTQKKRRKQGKTDYKLRLGLLKSGLARIVIRKTNKYIIAQVVESDEAQDRVVAGVVSKELLKHGWDEKYSGSLKSVPAGYFTGLLLGKKIGKEKEYILDIGMGIHLKASRIYAVAKGLVDAGVKVRVSESVFPDEKRLKGEHLKPEIKEMIGKVKI